MEQEEAQEDRKAGSKLAHVIASSQKIPVSLAKLMQSFMHILTSEALKLFSRIDLIWFSPLRLQITKS